jgi:hypothetical protein
MDAYERGWIMDIEPENLPQDVRNLKYGRAVEGWIRLDSDQLHELIEMETSIDSSWDIPLPMDFPRLVDEICWKKISYNFFNR